MKLIILQEKLKEGISSVGRISGKSLTLPILKNVLLKTEKNLFSLTTTDLEIGITWWGLAKVEEEGEITIPEDLFSSFLNLLPNKQIALSGQNQILSVECENYKTKIKGNVSDEFPIIPQVSKNESIKVGAKSFCQGLMQVSDVASFSTSRPEISGVFLSFKKDSVRMAATDSFRLAEKIISLSKEEVDKECEFIIPQKTAKEIVSIFGDKEGEMTIYPGANQVMFEIPMKEGNHPQVQLSSRLIDGEYPNYQEIVPKEYESQIIASKEEFLNKVKAATIFSGKINEIRFKINPAEEEMTIFSQNSETGDFNTSIKAKVKGIEEEVSFDGKFVLDGINSIGKSSELFFGLRARAKTEDGSVSQEDPGPGVIKPVGDSSFTYVVMPIRSA